MLLSVAVPPEYKTPIDGTLENPEGWNSGAKLRISDDHQMVVGMHPSHDLWATPDLIARSNEELGEVGSLFVLKAGDRELKPKRGVEGAPPHALKKVDVFRKTQDPEDRAKHGLKTPGDCGYTAHEVMGTPNQGKASASAAAEYHIGGEHRHSQPEDAEATWKHVHNAIWQYYLFRDGVDVTGLTMDEALMRYAKLSPEERDNVDREVGLNRYVQPKIGQAYSTASFGFRAPVRSDLVREGLFRRPDDGKSWGYHYAGVIMRSGGDSVTIENFRVGRGEDNTEWAFNMYGTERGQTFHDAMIASGTFGFSGPGDRGIAAVTIPVHKREP